MEKLYAQKIDYAVSSEIQPVWYMKKQLRDEEKRKYLLQCKERGKEMKQISALGRSLLKETKTLLKSTEDDTSSIRELKDKLFMDFTKATQKYIFMSTKSYYQKLPLVDFSQSVAQQKKTLYAKVIDDVDDISTVDFLVKKLKKLY